MTQLTPAQSKAAALALLLAVLALAAAAVATPLWLLNRRYDAALEDATTRLQRYARIAGMREGLQKKAIQVNALGKTPHFLKSASPALAAAELQEQARVVLEANGGKLNSIQILPPKDEGAYRQVSVSMQLTTPLSGLKAMLHALESARPYLFIDNFSVRSPMAFVVRNPAVEPDLAVQFDLTGYALKAPQ